MNIIFGNYGDSTLALIQWAKNNNISNLAVINIETGWGSPSWALHVNAGKALAEGYGFATKTLTAPESMEALVRERGEFPSVQFQWCPGLLKGLPFLLWLDEVDPQCEATIILGGSLGSQPKLPLDSEWVEESEHYGDRAVRYPLYQHSTEQIIQLIQLTGLTPSLTRSLECNPCIHSTPTELGPLPTEDLAKIQRLEEAVGNPMFPDFCTKNPEAVKIPSSQTTTFDMGCGSPYSCGDLITHQRTNKEPSS